MPQYSFVSIWEVEAPIESVWAAIKESEKWPSWWKYVAKVVELKKGDESGVGGVRRYTWASPLPYRVVYAPGPAAFMPLWPRNVRVGENSPSLCPTMSSCTNTFRNLFPL